MNVLSGVVHVLLALLFPPLLLVGSTRRGPLLSLATTRTWAATRGGSIAFVPDAAADVQAALCPAGPWGGTQRPIEALARLSGLPVTSVKRERRTTRSGGVSDHWTGCAECFAIDLGATAPAGDAAASRIATAIGGPGYADWGSTGGVLNVERCGIRFQLLWRTFVGGNHWDHIHVGGRRVGYAP